MNAKTPGIAIAALLLTAGVAGVLILRSDNARRRAHVEALRATSRELAQLREETAPRRTELARASAAHAAKLRAVRAEIAEVRRQVAALEKRDPKREASGTGSGAGASLSPANRTVEIDPDNRDPEMGLVRSEHFANVGHATPSAAFQTVIWAALKGEEHVLRSALTLDDPARKKAEEMLARLPSEGRAKYPTPESLAALVWLWMAEHMQGMAFRVVGTDLTDATHAIIRTLSGGSEREQPVRMEFGAGGWRLVVSEGAIDSFKRRMDSGTLEPPAKK